MPMGMGIPRSQSVQAPRSEPAALHRLQTRRPNSNPRVTPPPAIGSGTAGPKAAQATTDSPTHQRSMRTWRAHISVRGRALPNHLGEKHLRSPKGNERTPAWNDHRIPNQGSGTHTSGMREDGIIDRTATKDGNVGATRTVSGTETRGTPPMSEGMTGILTVNHPRRRRIRQTPKSKSEMPCGEPRRTTHRPARTAMTCQCLTLDNTRQSRGETALSSRTRRSGNETSATGRRRAASHVGRERRSAMRPSQSVSVISVCRVVEERTLSLV